MSKAWEVSVRRNPFQERGGLLQGEAATAPSAVLSDAGFSSSNVCRLLARTLMVIACNPG